MIILIPLAESDQCRDDVIITRMFFRICLYAEGMRETIDTEGSLMYEEYSSKACVDKRAPEIAHPIVVTMRGKAKPKKEQWVNNGCAGT